MQIGHETCTTAEKYPSMQIVDLALTISDKRTAYPYDKARIIVTSALDHYCPKARPSAAPVVAKTAQDYDQEFMQRLVSQGWKIMNTDTTINDARYTCILLGEGGRTPAQAAEMYATQKNAPMADAEGFVNTVMTTYPNCPAR
ncbi:hypothetical protein MSTE_01752 [Mycobacteroides stephanolepidis]|uniref:DUF732 domain-containing protein n=2 Tax=[Mycobacterium] stephanolepidis TaxID=1520670 RepID=A0A1Z4EVU9_9MYCO|nr:hypothetical protein MSTE_01752 [[Mycobacterium] stephanolepidis]